MRNVITISHLDPKLHQWLKDEAARRSKDGDRVYAWQVLQEAVAHYKEVCAEATPTPPLA